MRPLPKDFFSRSESKLNVERCEGKQLKLRTRYCPDPFTLLPQAHIIEFVYQ